jgi:hypothetical protein
VSLKPIPEDEIPYVSWSISTNPKCILDTEGLKRWFALSTEHTQLYKNAWKDHDCIGLNHNMAFIDQEDIIVVCEDCNTFQCFNRLH